MKTGNHKHSLVNKSKIRLIIMNAKIHKYEMSNHDIMQQKKFMDSRNNIHSPL